jgi:hypothetical protein
VSYFKFRSGEESIMLQDVFSRLVPKSLLVLSFAAEVMLAVPSLAQQAILQKLTWGNPDQPWGGRRPVTDADRKAIMLYRSADIQAVYATSFDDPQKLSADWLFQSDDYLQSCRRPENVVATPGGLQLRTRVATDCKAKWSTGSIISKQPVALWRPDQCWKAGAGSEVTSATSSKMLVLSTLRTVLSYESVHHEL